MGIEIRSATVTDLAGIVETFLGCWKQSYAAVLPAELVSSMDRERAEALWTRVLSKAGSGVTWVAAEVLPNDGATQRKILGVTRFEVAPDRCGKVHSLYVSPGTQGMGLGARLLTTTTDALARAGCVKAQLWVFADNAPSLGFYRSQGWQAEGSERIQPEFGQREVQLVKTLAPAQAGGGSQ